MNYAVQEKYSKSGAWRTLFKTTSRKSAIKQARRCFRKHPTVTFRVVSL